MQRVHNNTSIDSDNIQRDCNCQHNDTKITNQKDSNEKLTDFIGMDIEIHGYCDREIFIINLGC